MFILLSLNNRSYHVSAVTRRHYYYVHLSLFSVAYSIAAAVIATVLRGLLVEICGDWCCLISAAKTLMHPH